MVQEQQKGERSTGEQEEMTNEELLTAQEVGKAALDNIDDEKLDDLLDEIDDVLEENAQEFVNAFVQKGGQ